MGEQWRFAPIREPWYIALARAVPDPQVEHPLAAIQAVLDDYGLEVVPVSAEAGDTEPESSPPWAGRRSPGVP
jgi:hypothetical protein